MSQQTPVSDVFNEDCMVGMRRYPDKFFDLAIVDPPYFKGVGKLGFFGTSQSSVGVPRGLYAIPDWDAQIPGQQYLDELRRISTEQIIWGINYFPFIHCAGRIIWDKVNGNSPFSDAEIASCSLIQTVRIFRYMWNGMSQAKSISDGCLMQGNKRLNEKRIHPTQKPIALYKWLLAKFGNGGGGYILDTHLGSQSSRIAAYDMGFNFVGFELDPDYYASGCRRFAEHASQAKLFTDPQLYHSPETE